MSDQLDLFRHQPVVLEEATAPERVGEPERAVASPSTQLTVLPGSSFEDIFTRSAS